MKQSILKFSLCSDINNHSRLCLWGFGLLKQYNSFSISWKTVYIETLVLHGPYLSILSSPEAMILKFEFYIPSKTGNNFRGRINFVKKICHEFCP